MGLRIITASDPLNDSAVAELRRRLHEGGLVAGAANASNMSDQVRTIIDRVRREGDEYVATHTREIHGGNLQAADLRVSAECIKAAHDHYCAHEQRFMEIVRRAADNIRDYQQAIRIADEPSLRRGGRWMSVRYLPLDRVCVYVPGGKAIYPSTVLMTVVPAQVAGVRQIVMVSPPTAPVAQAFQPVHAQPGKAVPPDCTCDIHPMVLALAGELGVAEVYRAAGVAGLAAAAWGTPTIRPVDKIVGPGNAYIAEAKRQLFGQVGIDSIAGPSEVLIVADETARADFVAADMLAQVEHDPGSAVLVTTSATLAGQVADEIERQLPTLKRSQAIGAYLDEYCAAVVVETIASACDVANAFAPEHLQIVTADDDAALKRIRHAGAIFLGAYTPVPVGDYYAGPSHVLPTAGTARFAGPLSVNDFLKASSMVRYDEASLSADAGDIIDIATSEGLTAHAAAVRRRKDPRS
ncbi:MAG: histidinol dehydrogenase [Planctomycetaceae bacterium]|nr:histidinol dehydrogenase [Planctomycetaceae bacterium]